MSLRYVVLHHIGIDNPHFDLMFETAPGSSLATWQSPDWPLHNKSLLTSIANHRRAYLEYEGPVSNNRGSVTRIAAGTHEIIEESELHLIVQIDTGQRLVLPRLNASC